MNFSSKTMGISAWGTFAPIIFDLYQLSKWWGTILRVGYNPRGGEGKFMNVDLLGCPKMLPTCFGEDWWKIVEMHARHTDRQTDRQTDRFKNIYIR